MATVTIIETYRAASGAGYSNADAQIIGERIKELEPVTPAILVDDARPEDSPLHKFFEWDDSVAAERYRVHQAQQVVNHLRVIIREEGPARKAFHSVTITETEGVERAYVSTQTVCEQPGEDYKKQIIAKAATELATWRRRYEEYKDYFPEVFGADPQPIQP